MKIVSSLTKPPLNKSLWDMKCGQPDAMFMSDFGFLKEMLVGSGWKVSITSRLPFWLMSLKVTLWVKGHCKMLSNSPLIITKNNDM